jgi:phenylacetate-CoA ligase
MSFLYSKERGVVGLGNVSNIVKYANEIEKLQVIQNNKDSIEVFVVSDMEKLQSTKVILEQELRYRLGDKMKITFEFVEHIPNEKSGKFLMIKSTLNLEDCLNNA